MVWLGVEHSGNQHVSDIAAEPNDDRLIRRIIPEGIASGDRRNRVEVAMRRRRRRRPFKDAAPHGLSPAVVPWRRLRITLNKNTSEPSTISTAPVLAIMFQNPHPTSGGYV